ncbi:MAG: RNA polymerase sigma factor [Methyloligellaceae bacterium]
MQPENAEPDRGLVSRSGSPDRAAPSADDALMARVAAGDARAFSELVDAQLDRVLAAARRVLGSDTEAEDVAQEAFLRLWRNADRWQPGRAKVSTWLYRVAVNLSIDRLRGRKETTTSEPPDSAVPPRQQRSVEEEDLKARMDHALQDLPERQRLALVLFHYEGLSMAEVADLLEASVEAVESLLARARRTLKTKLAKQWKALLPETEC